MQMGERKGGGKVTRKGKDDERQKNVKFKKKIVATLKVTDRH